MPLLFLPFRRFAQQASIASVGDSSGAEQPTQSEPVKKTAQRSDRCQQQEQIPYRD